MDPVTASSFAQLTDLPPELLDHITQYIPTAQALASLEATNKTLQAFVKEHAWQTFNRCRFPSTCPLSPPSHRDAAQTLTGLSRAWDRRALIARYIEPHGEIVSYPGGQKNAKWKKPRGQTMGYAPHMDVLETTGSTWRDRSELLAFSAGAELCLRRRQRYATTDETTAWRTYRPLSAYEGRDDITSVHLLRSAQDQGADDSCGLDEVVVGTANGDLRLLKIPVDSGEEVQVTYLVTQGNCVRTSDILRACATSPYLTANLGDSRIALFNVEPDVSHNKIAPISTVDINLGNAHSTGRKQQRVWSVKLLDQTQIAVGIGPSKQPIQIHTITPTGIEKDPNRRLALDADTTINVDGSEASGLMSSVYPIVPLSPSSSANSETRNHVFLSGAYDGVVRLHDLRSARDSEQVYSDPTDDSAIYSLLPRGREMFIAGTSRHCLLKVFDLRLGSKAYSYLDAETAVSSHGGVELAQTRSGSYDWNLFTKATGGARWGRNDRSQWSRQRGAESSIYNLTASSPYSPYFYAGLESAVMELAVAGSDECHPDPALFPSWPPLTGGEDGHGSSRSHEALNLAMYDQSPHMRLYTQKDMWNTRQSEAASGGKSDEGSDFRALDPRWQLNV